MKKKGALAVTALAAAAVALAGCSATPARAVSSAKPSGGPSGTLEVDTNFPAGSALETALQNVTNAFTKKDPDVTINLVPATTNYEANLKVRLAAGNPPDIFHTNGWSLLRYSPFLMPMQKQAWAKYLNPALDSAMVGSNGDFYAMPFDADVSGILYNKTVLQKAGVNPADITTWAAFDKAAKAIKADGVSPIYASEKANGPAGNFIDWLAPGIFSASDMAKMKAGTSVAPKYKEMLQTVAQWKADGFFNPDYVSASVTNMSQALAEGHAGFIFTQNYIATSAFTFNPSAKIGYIPIPAMDGGTPYFVGGEQDAFGISKKTKYPAAAHAYIDFLAQPANETKMAAAAGSAPGLTDAKVNLGGLQSSYDTYIEKGKVPVDPYFDRVALPDGMWQTVVNTTDSIITGQATVDQALAKAQSEFTLLHGQSSK